MRSYQIFLFFLVVTSVTLSVKALSCLSPENKKVDWFVIFLLPAKESEGLTYSYADSTSQSLKYLKLNEKTFPPLALVKSLKDAVTKIIWNDDQSTDDQDRASDSKAHSKGFLAYDENSGFHLLHSLPRFPKLNDKGKIIFTLPDNAGDFGQTFFCSSLSLAESKKMEKNVGAIDPFLYEESDIPSNLKGIQVKEDGDLASLSTKQNLKLQILYEESDIPISNLKGIQVKEDGDLASVITKQNLKLQIFLKKKANKKLPWEGKIQSFYKEGFYVETWTRPKILPNICKKGSETLGITGLTIHGVEFTDNNDHSKWGVSLNKKICCFGDLNRTETQEKRSGMVICFENSTIGNQIYKFISNFKKCKT